MKNAKTEDEGFSELIKRNIKRRPKLGSLAGKRTIDKKDWKMIQALIKSSELQTGKVSISFQKNKKSDIKIY